MRQIGAAALRGNTMYDIPSLTRPGTISTGTDVLNFR
jgi:hypothetical protein